jgi:sulfite reductase (NADPH) flavoprotein alpha-component
VATRTWASSPRYETSKTDVSPSGTHFGTGSNFLFRREEASGSPRPVSVQMIRPSHFDLPVDPGRPVVMFAGGTGLSPFLAMLAERACGSGMAENWLILATRTRADLLAEDVLSEFAAEGRLQARIAFSCQDLGAVSAPRS